MYKILNASFFLNELHKIFLCMQNEKYPTFKFLRNVVSKDVSCWQ